MPTFMTDSNIARLVLIFFHTFLLRSVGVDDLRVCVVRQRCYQNSNEMAFSLAFYPSLAFNPIQPYFTPTYNSYDRHSNHTHYTITIPTRLEHLPYHTLHSTPLHLFSRSIVSNLTRFASNPELHSTHPISTTTTRILDTMVRKGNTHTPCCYVSWLCECIVSTSDLGDRWLITLFLG